MRDAIHDAFSNSINPNTSSYRIERRTFQTDNKTHALYKVKTGNPFTDKTTFSKKTALEWLANGETVYMLNEKSGRIIARLVPDFE